MGGAESALLGAVPVKRVVVLAAVSPGRRSGSAAACDDEPYGAHRVPTAPKPGAVLGAVKDKPYRARLRASLTAPATRNWRRRPGRGNGRPAEQGNRPTRTARAEPGSCWMKGRPLRGRAFPFPFPRAVERWGTGTGNGAPISGLGAQPEIGGQRWPSRRFQASLR